MKLIILGVPAFALFFSIVQHPGLCLAGVVLTMVALLTLRSVGHGRRFFRSLDEACAPYPRRHGVWPFVGLLVLAACRSAAPAIPPTAGLAEVATLECGARVCAVTEVAGVTMVTVAE
jgi:hypothetical protein